jgi:hypothetical protein
MVPRSRLTLLVASLVLAATLLPVAATPTLADAGESTTEHVPDAGVPSQELRPAGGDQSHSQATGSAVPPDPETDRIGWENGYWYNESIDVSQVDEDGLTAAEQRRLMARTMARVERLRELEFTANVSLRFVDRDRFRQGFMNTSLPPAISSAQLYDSFTTDRQFWEATFVYGGDTDATRRIRRFGAEAILAYSAEEGFQNEVVVVTRDADAPAVRPDVLAHELLHALQGQHFDVAADRYHPQRHDERLGKDGLVEGAAAYVDSLYTERCRDSWDCIATPSDWAGRGEAGAFTYSYVVAMPYADGGAMVHDVVQAGGWPAVTDRHRSLPASSEQVIHRNPDADVLPLDAPDQSGADWELRTRERVGETTMFVMFWRQSVERSPAVLDPNEIGNTSGDYDPLNFESEPSAGWGNDELLLYDSADGDGYVWHTKWDSTEDAREFVEAYRTLLESYEGERRGSGIWVIPEKEPFGDAFHVVRNGSRVRIVNAPTMSALSELADVEASQKTPTPSTTSGTPDEPTSTSTTGTPETASSPSTREPTTDGQGGLSLLVPLATLVSLAVLTARRSH